MSNSIDMNDQIKKYAEFWRTYRFRPPESNLRIHENHIRLIKEKVDPSVLILGVTPELRMISLENRCRVTAVDESMIIINAMYDFMDYSKVSEDGEVIVKSDWLNMPLETHSYDLAIGDGSLNELPALEDYEKLLIKIKVLLKPHGYFSTRIGVIPNNWSKVNLIKVLKEKRKGLKEKNFWEIYDPDLALRMMFSLDSFDEETYQMTYEKTIEELTGLYREKKITKEEFEAFLWMYGLDKSQFPFDSIPKFWMECIRTFPRERLVEELLVKYFNIVSKINEPNVPAYVYLLRSKNKP